MPATGRRQGPAAASARRAPTGGGVERWLAGGVECAGGRLATGSGGRRVAKRPARGGGWIAVWVGEAGVMSLFAAVNGAEVGTGGEIRSLEGGCDAHRHAADAAGQPREETRHTAEPSAAEESEGSGRPRIGASAVCTALP
jgi:hypothetical protein